MTIRPCKSDDKIKMRQKPETSGRCINTLATRISDSPDAGWEFVLMVLPNIYGSIIAIFSHTSYLQILLS
jgi:hypothetical protein